MAAAAGWAADAAACSNPVSPRHVNDTLESLLKLPPDFSLVQLIGCATLAQATAVHTHQAAEQHCHSISLSPSIPRLQPNIFRRCPPSVAGTCASEWAGADVMLPAEEAFKPGGALNPAYPQAALLHAFLATSAELRDRVCSCILHPASCSPSLVAFVLRSRRRLPIGWSTSSVSLTFTAQIRLSLFRVQMRKLEEQNEAIADLVTGIIPDEPHWRHNCSLLRECIFVMQMRNLEEQNSAIAEFLVSGDASRLSTPARPPRRHRPGPHGAAPSEIGCVIVRMGNMVRMCFMVHHLLMQARPAGLCGVPLPRLLISVKCLSPRVGELPIDSLHSLQSGMTAPRGGWGMRCTPLPLAAAAASAAAVDPVPLYTIHITTKLLSVGSDMIAPRGDCDARCMARQQEALSVCAAQHPAAPTAPSTTATARVMRPRRRAFPATAPLQGGRTGATTGRRRPPPALSTTPPSSRATTTQVIVGPMSTCDFGSSLSGNNCPGASAVHGFLPVASEIQKFPVAQ